MKTFEQFKSRIAGYKGVDFIYDPGIGYIAWQVSTGDNVELMFIETVEPLNGFGKELIRRMCKRIEPYHSVFVVRLAKNENAGGFYQKLGFTETLVPGLYAGDDAVIGVIPFDKLKRNLGE